MSRFPEFRLDNPQRVKEKPGPRIVFTKNSYNSLRTKVDNWQYVRENEPKDNNPYDPPGGSHFLSTYNRMSDAFPNEFSTTTKTMQEQIWTRHHYECKDPFKPKINFFSYTNVRPKAKVIPKCDEQNLFPSPLKDIHAGKPFNFYHRATLEHYERAKTQFMDDDVRNIQTSVAKVKKDLYRSYVPWTGKYTDEAFVDPKQFLQPCTQIKYGQDN